MISMAKNDPQKRLAAARADVAATEKAIREADDVRTRVVERRDAALTDSTAYGAAARAETDALTELARLRALLGRQLDEVKRAEREALAEELARIGLEAQDAITSVRTTAETVARAVAATRQAKAKMDTACAGLTELRARSQEIAKQLGITAPHLYRGEASSIAYGYQQALLYQLNAPDTGINPNWWRAPDLTTLLASLRDAHGLRLPPAELDYPPEEQLADISADPERYRQRVEAARAARDAGRAPERERPSSFDPGRIARKVGRFAGVF